MDFEAKAVSKNYVEGKIYNKNVIFYKPEIDALYEQKKLGSASLPDSEIKLTFEELLQHALPVDINTKILVYEDRVTTWFLDIAKKLKEDNEAGFVILQIACSQIEGNQQHFEGKSSKKRSKDVFISGLKRFFRELEKTDNYLLEDFYDEVRCGLMHNGITKSKVTINASAHYAIEVIDRSLVTFENGKYNRVKEGSTKYNLTNQLIHESVVNPHLFLGQVEKGINEYIQKLKDSNERQLRINFEKFFDETG